MTGHEMNNIVISIWDVYIYIIINGSLYCIYESNKVKVNEDNDWETISSSLTHNMAIKKDGTLWSWGNNTYGQLGLNDSIDRDKPTKVGNHLWKQVSCGYNFTVAIRDDNTLWSWGDNDNGQLGLGDYFDRHIPTKIDIGRKWKQVSCGYGHTLAITMDDMLYSWGDNSNGQLGINDTQPRITPIPVNFDTDWDIVYCGAYHNLVTKKDKSVYSFGLNTTGQLGIESDSFDSILIPHKSTYMSNIQTASLGQLHTTCIIDNDLYTFGRNTNGELGFSRNDYDNYIPFKLTETGDWIDVKCGQFNTIALNRNGEIYITGTIKGSIHKDVIGLISNSMHSVDTLVPLDNLIFK